MPFKKVMNKIKPETLDKFKIPSTDFQLFNADKKKRTQLIQERDQLLKVIGMELYDAYQAGDIELPLFNHYFDKLKDIDLSIKELQQENICSCGTAFKDGAKFCSNCGNTISELNTEKELVMITCYCGNQYSEEDGFCDECGRSIENK